MNPKRRFACSDRKRSARNPQKTDTTRRLKTLAYTKKNRPAARRAGPSRNVRSPKNATKLAANACITAGTNTRRGVRWTRAPNSGLTTSVPASVPKKSQFRAKPPPVDAPISSRSGRMT